MHIIIGPETDFFDCTCGLSQNSNAATTKSLQNLCLENRKICPWKPDLNV